MGLQYTFASSYGSGDRDCDRDGNKRCDRCAGNCNQSGGQSGDNFSWEQCTGGAKPYNEGGWLYRREISLGQHGSRGCKHRCFSVCSPYLGYEQGAKQSPCTDSKQRKFIGYKWKGGGGWHGNNDNVRVSKFNDSNTALQCLFDVNASKLKTWSNKSYITKAGAKDDNGRFMNQYDQMLWGIRIKDGLEQQIGFCHAGNADTVVHQNGKTCQELAADNFSSLPSSDSRWGIWDTLTDASCSKLENLTKIIKPNSNVTCSDRDTSKTLAKQWCSIGKNIVTDSQSFCTKEELGTALYEELAAKYCDSNPDDPFCGCYNVVTNKCKGEDIDKEIKRLEDARKPIEGVRYVWFGFDNKTEYLNIAQIEVYSDGVNIVKDIDDSKVTVGSQYNGTQYLKNQLFDGNYISMYHSAGKPNDWIKIELGKEYTIDEIKVFNRHSCGSTESNNICNDRWAGSFVKLLDSSGNLIKASEKVVGDHKEGGVRVKTFFDNGVAAAKEKLTIPGCKITVPIRRTLTDLPRKYSAALDGTDKCWGNVCATGTGKYVPEGTTEDAICGKSMTICSIDLKAGNLQDSDINIEQKCGEQEGTPAPMSPSSSGEPSEPSEPSDGSTDGTPAPMTDSSTIPLETTTTSTPASSSSSTEELKIYEKPAFQIGTVASSLVSISSCAMLIMLAM